MERPLDIAFHNMEPAPEIEAEIRRHVERVETRYGRLVGCRVSVEALHQQHKKGNLYEVHITLSLPGKDLAVSREPHHAKERHSHPDALSSLRDAFKAIERQLESHKGHLREDTSPPSASALAGRVTQIEPGADHGFILNSTGSQVYFHCDSVTNGRFAELREGDLVHYVEEESDAGPTATKIRLGSDKY